MLNQERQQAAQQLCIKTKALNQARRLYRRAAEHKAFKEMRRQKQRIQELATDLDIALFCYRIDFHGQQIH